MIIDRLLNVSTAQAVTTTAVSEDSVDLTTARDIGSGEPLALTVQVTTTATADGAATVTINAISADDAALTSNVVVHASTGAIGKATLVAGYRVSIGIPPETNIGADRYWGASYTVATGPLTAGVFEAWYGPRDFAHATPNQYPDALLVSGF